HTIALVVFIVFSAIFSNMLIVDNNGHFIENDISQHKANWDDTSYSGRPQIITEAQPNTNNIFTKIISGIKHTGNILPFIIILASLIGIYILLNCLKISPASAILGSLAFGFFSYGIAELQAGEFTEMIAIGIMPYVLAGIVQTFNGRKIIGTIITLIATALLTATCHYQILYYTLLCALAYTIYALATKENQTKQKLASLAITIAVLVGGILTNSEAIFNEYEYSKYAVQPLPDYNVEKPYFDDGGESLSLLIPNIKGGKSASKLSCSSETQQLLEPLFGQENATKLTEKSPTYFGKRQFSNGTAYIGALALLLALFGSICSPRKVKWAFIATTILAIILSCGNIEYFITKNIPLFYNFSHFSNILIISAIGISVLAALGTEEIITHNSETNEKRKTISLYISTGILSVILLIFVIFPSIAGNQSTDQNNMAEIGVSEMLASYMPQDIEYAEAVAEFKNDYITAIRNDRISLVRRDAAKSLVFILIGASIAFFAIRKKLNGKIVAGTLAVLVLADSTFVNLRDLGTDKTETAQPTQNIADKTITSDKGTFRVLDIRYDAVQNDNATHLKFNSLGGGDSYYTKRYATLCDSILNKELALTRYNILSWAQRDGMSQEEIQEIFTNKYKSPILDMLNVKYIILSEKAEPLENKHASGNVWLVDSIRIAVSETLELAKLQHIDTKKTAIVNEKYKLEFADVEFSIDSTDLIEMTYHKGDTIKYKSSCKGNRLAVFSETFYPKGWKARIDGKKASFFRCNYILRGMIIPAGEHEIEFSYMPKTAKIGGMVSLICNILTLTMIAFLCTIYIIKKIRRKKQPKTLNHDFEIR
ncbi:MAG: YfhO family protein, partial [Bacteroidales bacterium]|nr:YfhO family protein [Bacteroidales bacterium]